MAEAYEQSQQAHNDNQAKIHGYSYPTQPNNMSPPQPISSPAPTYYSQPATAPPMMHYGVPPPQNQYQHPHQQGQQYEQWKPQPQVIVQETAQVQIAMLPQIPQQAVPIPSLNRTSAPVDCPNCRQRKMTVISYHAGGTAHVWAGALFLLTGCLCFIPYVGTSLKDVHHNCGGCGRLLAIWHKSGQVEVHSYA